jgi:DNA mismatch endonuclease (patch repair protein)
VDGCFWHGCPDHGVRPKTNTAFWNKKLEENRVRDVRVSEELENQNWKVIRFWEHQIMGGLDTVVDAVLKEVSE